jgi:hypothetical protein
MIKELGGEQWLTSLKNLPSDTFERREEKIA